MSLQRLALAGALLTSVFGSQASAGCELDPRIPARLVKHVDEQALCAGFLDPTRPPYGAAGDGTGDDTGALQSALNDAYALRMAVRLPAGSVFRVSRQIRAVQEGRPSDMREYGYQLIGAPGFPRATIRLADNSAVNSSNPVLLYYQLEENGRPNPPSHYSAMLRNVDIDMGTNPTISAVSMSGAQLCSIEDVTITGKSFLAGIVGLPGSGGFTSNVRVVGGQVGVWQEQYRPNPSITGLFLANQSCCEGCCSGSIVSPAGILLDQSRGPLVVSGFSISGFAADGYAAVRVRGQISSAKTGSVGTDSSLALEDGSIRVEKVSGAADQVSVAIANDADHDCTLKDVWVEAAVAVSCGNTSRWNAETGSWRRVPFWSYTSEGSSIVVGGRNLSQDRPNFAYPQLNLTYDPVSYPPAGLVTRHSWDADQVPAWVPGDGQLIDIVRDYNATPDWVDADDDDGPKIQMAIDAAAERDLPVFIPRGIYHTRESLVLRNGSKLIGSGKHVATLSSDARYWPTELERVAPVLALPKYAENAFVSDLVLLTEYASSNAKIPPTWVLDIRSRNALVKDIRTYAVQNTNAKNVTTPSLELAAVSISGAEASGKVYGLSLDHFKVSGWQPHLGLMLAVNGTRGDVHLYQTSVEHHAARFQTLLFNSSKVYFHAFKYESTGIFTTKDVILGGGLLEARQCGNVTLFGGSGNYGIMNASMSPDILLVEDTDWFLAASMVRKPQPSEIKQETFWVRDVDEQYNATASMPSLLLYRR